ALEPFRECVSKAAEAEPRPAAVPEEPVQQRAPELRSVEPTVARPSKRAALEALFKRVKETGKRLVANAFRIPDTARSWQWEYQGPTTCENIVINRFWGEPQETNAPPLPDRAAAPEGADCLPQACPA